MMEKSLADRVSWMGGMYVGLLTGQDLADFEAAEKAGIAYRDYGNPIGFMGFSRVALLAQEGQGNE